MLAFFGMGLLGSNFVRALRRRGEEVNVWNRTAAKAKALEEVGARAFDDPAAAVRGATRLHLTLSDDAAVDDVLEKARPGLAANVTIVDHTTTSVTGSRERGERWRDRGFRFMHAPVFMGPQNALESTGTMLMSGDPALVAELRPLLKPMTGKLVDCGEDPTSAAAFKLLGNCFLMFLTAGLADLFTLGKALGIPAQDAAVLFDYFNPGATIAMRAERMMAAQHSQPSWELAMAAKDARIMIEEAQRGGVKLTGIPAIFARMNELIAEGHGGDDWCVLGKDAV